MRRGDLITVAVSGDHGKLRPALMIQPDFLADTDRVLVCLLTTTQRDAPPTGWRFPRPRARRGLEPGCTRYRM